MLLYKKNGWLTRLNPGAMIRVLLLQRKLLLRMARRAIEVQYKGSTLGIIWALLSPVLLFGVYAFVFIAIFDTRFGVVPDESRVDYAIGLFLGLTLLQMFQEALLISPLAIVQNPNYVKKVVFPLEILPMAGVLAAGFRCVISLFLVLTAAFVVGPGPSLQVAWLFPLLFALLMLSAGTALFLSALGVFLRDIAPLVQFLSVLLMFVSAVFYSFDQVPAAFSFLRFNPLLQIVEIARDVVLWHRAPPMTGVLYVVACGSLLFVLGQFAFESLRSAFSDVL